jgi:hypothetical protein
MDIRIGFGPFKNYNVNTRVDQDPLGFRVFGAPELDTPIYRYLTSHQKIFRKPVRILIM